MKKCMAFMVTVLMAASLAACGGASEPAAKPAETTLETVAEEAEEDVEALETIAADEEDEEAEEDRMMPGTGGLILYQYDKDNMDVEYEDPDEACTLEELEQYNTVTEVKENGMLFYEVKDADDDVTYYINKEDYKDRLVEVDVTLDNFDAYFELIEEEIWNDDGVVFNKYYRLKDDYLFAMVDYDHLYANTGEVSCKPIDYIGTIDVENQTYDWGIYDVTYGDIEEGIDFEDCEENTYKNVIVSTYPENYIEDNGDGTASGVAHEDVKLIEVSITFYYLKTK